MAMKDYYQEGSYNDSQAPWNDDRDVFEEKKFECHVVVTLERDLLIPTRNYSKIIEKDDCGGICEYDTEFVVWENEYSEHCVTLGDMLDKLKNYVEHDLSLSCENSKKSRYLKTLLEACQKWETTCTYVTRLC